MRKRSETVANTKEQLTPAELDEELGLRPRTEQEKLIDRARGDGPDAIEATREVSRQLADQAHASLQKLEESTRKEPPIPRAALERYTDFAPGDTIGITLGAELYSPVKYNTFTVGPFSATVVVRPDETGADAAMRCYRVLLELNEAEFNIAWGRQRERLQKLGEKR